MCFLNFVANVDVFLKTIEVGTFNGFILLNSDKISKADCPLEVFLYRSFAHTMIKFSDIL